MNYRPVMIGLTGVLVGLSPHTLNNMPDQHIYKNLGDADSGTWKYTGTAVPDTDVPVTNDAPSTPQPNVEEFIQNNQPYSFYIIRNNSFLIGVRKDGTIDCPTISSADFEVGFHQMAPGYTGLINALWKAGNCRFTDQPP